MTADVPTCACRRGAAERVLEAAVAALRARPPAGVTAADIEGFLARRRDALLGLVDAAVARGTGSAA